MREGGEWGVVFNGKEKERKSFTDLLFCQKKGVLFGFAHVFADSALISSCGSCWYGWSLPVPGRFMTIHQCVRGEAREECWVQRTWNSCAENSATPSPPPLPAVPSLRTPCSTMTCAVEACKAMLRFVTARFGFLLTERSRSASARMRCAKFDKINRVVIRVSAPSDCWLRV